MVTAKSEKLAGWFAGRIPDDWFTGPADVTYDDDEILVVGEVAPPDVARNADADTKEAARIGRIDQFRQDTRDSRIRIAREAERLFGRKVSWGARCGDTTRLFTSTSVPVMTRLRMTERGVLDTLIDAGVARSRSDALAWCVRLVGKNQKEWIDNLRAAFAEVEKVRAQGPET